MSQLILEGTMDYRPPYRAQIVQSLAEIRREWEKMVGGESLIEVKASVGLLLEDIADRLQLSTQERYAMLGGKLINEVDCMMEERIRARLPS